MKKKIFFLFLIICLSLTPFASYADNEINENIANEPVDLNAKCSIILELNHRGVIFEDEPVELYKVANISNNYIFTLTEEFEATGVTLNGAITKGEWNIIRSTIDSYIVSENILPMKVDFTDENGKIVFDNLEPGMYFTSSVRTARNNIGYRFDSVLSSLPNLKDGLPVYDVEVKTKPERDNPPKEKIRYRVSKLWKDEKFEKLRPENIEIEIFKNKELQETVVLNAENNWFYSWEAEDDGSEWMISENIASDKYVVLVEKRDTTFVLINQYKDETSSDDNTKPEVPGDTDSDTGDSFNVSFYVVVMSLSGIALVLISIIGNKIYNKNDNN